MSDTASNKFLAYGTDAERSAFTPSPATLAAAPFQLYLWYTTDTLILWIYTTAWAQAGGGGGGGGGGVSAVVGNASEAIGVNKLVNIFDAGGGTFAVQLADASDPTKPAMGFVNAAVAMGDPATVQFSGLNAGQSGLTPGPVYLDAAGGTTSTAPSTPGELLQPVGFATSAAQLYFNPQSSIAL